MFLSASFTPFTTLRTKDHRPIYKRSLSLELNEDQHFYPGHSHILCLFHFFIFKPSAWDKPSLHERAPEPHKCLLGDRNHLSLCFSILVSSSSRIFIDMEDSVYMKCHPLPLCMPLPSICNLTTQKEECLSGWISRKTEG